MQSIHAYLPNWVVLILIQLLGFEILCRNLLMSGFINYGCLVQAWGWACCSCCSATSRWWWRGFRLDNLDYLLSNVIFFLPFFFQAVCWDLLKFGVMWSVGSGIFGMWCWLIFSCFYWRVSLVIYNISEIMNCDMSWHVFTFLSSVIQVVFIFMWGKGGPQLLKAMITNRCLDFIENLPCYLLENIVHFRTI